MEYTITGKTPDKLEEKLAQYRKLTALRDELTERLQKTDAEKSSVSSKIFEKVKQEYSGKLENVRNQLSPIQSDLERDKKECSEELPRLGDEIRVMEEELSEAEFRFRVGEFDQIKLTEIQTRLNPDLAEKSELHLHLTERLEKINAVFGEDTPGEDTPASAEPTDQIEVEEEESKVEETATDDGSSSRVTLPSDDPLEALTDKPADMPDVQMDDPPVDESDDSDAGDGKQSKKDTAAAVDTDEKPKKKDKGESPFENPQEWIDELGEDDGNPGSKYEAKTGTGKPKSGAKKEKSSEDPLSALADPSGDAGNSKKTATAEAPPEREEVSAGFPNMVIITGPSSGKKIPLLPMTMSIGREHDNNIELKDPDVGRYHARILYDSGRFVLEDLESSNGTWLNGEQISEAALKNGDRIKIGETELAIDFD